MTLQPDPLWPIKQRYLACLWRTPNSVTSSWYINRRRTPEITRWCRTKYAIKVMVIRPDRKPICFSHGSGPSLKIPFPSSCSCYRRFTAILALCHPRDALRSSRVFNRKKKEKNTENKTTKKGLCRTRPDSRLADRQGKRRATTVQSSNYGAARTE